MSRCRGSFRRNPAATIMGFHRCRQNVRHLLRECFSYSRTVNHGTSQGRNTEHRHFHGHFITAITGLAFRYNAGTANGSLDFRANHIALYSRHIHSGFRIHIHTAHVFSQLTVSIRNRRPPSHHTCLRHGSGTCRSYAATGCPNHVAVPVHIFRSQNRNHRSYQHCCHQAH